MTSLQMPRARAFGWKLRETGSSHFRILRRPNGQFCVVLNHGILRGVTCEMLRWWFLNFPNLRVRLIDVPGYEEQLVPAYLLWHPIDHYDARLFGRLGPGGTARAGAGIHIREAMQYDRYGWRYPADTRIRIFYVGEDGWAMGKKIPMLGPVMMLRIHFHDVKEGDRALGVHYHYEVVIGVTGHGSAARFANRRISAHFGPAFFDAWHRHNVIEVGVFENFLGPLFAQRNAAELRYERSMDPMAGMEQVGHGFSEAFFDRRVGGYEHASDPYQYQAFDRASMVPEGVRHV
ncbi:MAG: hypothetical protein AAGA55_04450 [Planctomycetota bacterium]